MALVEGKWKRSVVILEINLKIITELEKDRLQRLVAEQLKVAKSATISDK